MHPPRPRRRPRSRPPVTEAPPLLGGVVVDAPAQLLHQLPCAVRRVGGTVCRGGVGQSRQRSFIDPAQMPGAVLRAEIDQPLEYRSLPTAHPDGPGFGLSNAGRGRQLGFTLRHHRCGRLQSRETAPDRTASPPDASPDRECGVESWRWDTEAVSIGDGDGEERGAEAEIGKDQKEKRGRFAGRG